MKGIANKWWSKFGKTVSKNKLYKGKGGAFIVCFSILLQLEHSFDRKCLQLTFEKEQRWPNLIWSGVKEIALIKFYLKDW